MSFVRAAVFLTSAVALVVACGSEESSTFNPETGGIDAGASSSSSGGFNITDSGGTPEAGNMNCKPLTCAEQGIECGPAGDGCGGLIMDCGKCATGLRCGGPGAPSKCVSPNIGTACTPKTCQDLNINCGPAGDGCGSIIASCGTCGPGKQCGNNTTASQCVDATPTGPDGGACVPRDCAYYTALGMNCGLQSDGCGGSITCGTCTVTSEFCGGGGANICGNPTVCVKKTCASYPTGTCGPQSDDCGGVTTNCGTCTLPEICGGGGVPSKCGGGSVTGPDGGACVPKSTCDSNQCGDIADGCGGILSCGTSNCTGGTLCGGGGTPNVCGTPTCTKTPQATACAGKNCGSVADGCGGLWSCGGTCPAPSICGGGGVANVCGGGTVLTEAGTTCTPKTAASCTTGQCGPYADGCGGLYNCGGCTTGTCGGAGTPGVCGGGNTCTAKTKTEACGTMNCGFAADGCGGYHTCGPSADGSCSDGQVCGLYAPNQCGSLSGPCINDTTTTCASNVQCCSGLCGALGKCISLLADGGTPSCTDISGSCSSGNQCCSGNCVSNVCQSSNGSACLASGSTCTGDSQCCSKGCIGGKCSLETSYCRQLNEACTTASQCCSGKCDGATSTKAGKCVDLGVAGIGNCNIAGTVTTCSSTTDYVCNSACCSGSCGPNDSTTGYAICQQPSGCGPLGELCNDDADCCGSTVFQGLRCVKPTGQTFGRCGDGKSCSKPGETCKTAADSCSFSNNCCEPADIGSSSCNSDPEKCCRHDNLGIPRCTQFATCRTVGQTCATAADCCPINGEIPPCTDHDNNPATANVCAAKACVDDGAFCTVDGDCCNSNCFKQNAGDLVGQCKIPTCTKKTCANYPGTCGQQSDGCGGLTENCGTCTYPQTCGGGGTPNVCGGTICTPVTSCPSGYECGSIPDGCGGTISCGTCVSPKTCGGGGTAYVCGQPTCNDLTCQEQGLQCGQTGDGCGNVITCPPCPEGTTCGGGGVANQCGAPACTPKSCPAGLNCGDYPNGCGGSVSCGTCPGGQICGGGGTPNVCGTASCTSKTCAQQYPTGIKNCGLISDLCGSVVSCGECLSGQSCVDNECIGTACVPKTCQQLGVQCGQVADGCGGLTPDCGLCPAGQGCGAGGTPNVCGSQPCAPKSCQDLGAVCGQIADGCGGLTPNCGDCGGNLSCKNGACVQACTPITCTAAGAECGFIADGCGGVLDCGVCQDGYECGYGGQANKCGRDQPK